MKDTKIMLAVIATFLTTWMIVSFIGYLLSDAGVMFNTCAKHPATIMFMLVLGWTPSFFIGHDVYDKVYGRA